MGQRIYTKHAVVFFLHHSALGRCGKCLLNLKEVKTKEIKIQIQKGYVHFL